MEKLSCVSIIQKSVLKLPPLFAAPIHIDHLWATRSTCALRSTIHVDQLEPYVTKLSEAGWNNYSPFKRLLWDETYVSAISTALLWSMLNMTLDRDSLIQGRLSNHCVR